MNADALRQRWMEMAADLGRDLAAGRTMNVAGRMEQLEHLGAYIALVEHHRRARRPRWQRWMFWRRVILVFAIVATLGLLMLALTHPSSATARLDLLASSIAFTAEDDLRLPIGCQFQTLSVTGLDRLEFPGDSGPTVISGKELVVSNNRESAGRLDWISIPRGARVRLKSIGNDIAITIATDPSAASSSTAVSAGANARTVPSIRWNLPTGAQLTIMSQADPDLHEELTVQGDARSGASVEGLCIVAPARLEATLLLPARDAASATGILRLSRFSGRPITKLACTESDIVSAETRSTLARGRVTFPDVEIPTAELEEGAWLTVDNLRGTLVRVEMQSDGVHLVSEGEVSDVLAGRGEQRSLMPSRLEHLFARRFRMYTAGVLMYAVVFIVALLRGQPASIGEGFQPQRLLSLRMGGHLP